MTLKELRKSKDISQSEAAKFLGIPLRSYKRYETEKKYEKTLKYSYLFEKLENYKYVNKEIKLIRKLNVVVAGIGYVGLSSAIVLSKKANVKLIDINSKKVDLINKKESPITGDCFAKEVKTSNLSATTNIFAYKNADIVLVATPTDLDPTINSLDTFSVESVVRTVKEINKKCLIVIRSTVPVGFTQKLINDYGNNIIFCPEFLREELAVNDAFNPTRIICGIKNLNKAVLKFQCLIENCIRNDKKVIFMAPNEAEATKLFSNAYLAMRIAFFNELDSFGIANNLNVPDIINGLGKDPRIGSLYNNPSVMFAGYCLPKDTKELENEMGIIENNQIISSIFQSNEARLLLIVKECISKAKKISGKENELVIGLYNFDENKTANVARLSSYSRFKNELVKNGIKVKTCNANSSQQEINKFFESSDLVYSDILDRNVRKQKGKIFTRNIN